MPDYPLEFFVDFIIPGLIGLVGLFFIWRGLKAYRRKPARRCLKCQYDMRESQSLSCPECGHVAKSQKEIEHGKVRRLPIALGVFLLLPILAIASFFAYYIPQTYFLRKHSQALEQILKQSHWPKVKVVVQEWNSAGNDWIAPWTPVLIDRDHLDEYNIWVSHTFYASRYDWRYVRDYMAKLVCAPGRHYGRHIELEVPIYLQISTDDSKPTTPPQVTSDQIIEHLKPLGHFIVDAYVDMDQEHDSANAIFNTLSRLKEVIVSTTDIALVEEAICKPALKDIYFIRRPPTGCGQDREKDYFRRSKICSRGSRSIKASPDPGRFISEAH